MTNLIFKSYLIMVVIYLLNLVQSGNVHKASKNIEEIYLNIPW